MASVFTYQEDVKRIHSPWSTPGNTTPQPRRHEDTFDVSGYNIGGITKLEPEKPDGPCEYKLHLLLRARRKFVSMTTTNPSSSYPHATGPPSLSSGTSPSELSFQRSTYQPSPQTRQARLQQLTTQLLWRLQQSSPFHSSSNAQLVLPLLPEATPRLGVPERPAKLLAGLEESQGALYELGVADDGTLVGLADDELEESLNNLRAMAASLGCVCDILLKVAAGHCEWLDNTKQDIESTLLRGELFVAEVLVRPDSRAAPRVTSAKGPEGDATPVNSELDALGSIDATTSSQQLRIAFAGGSAAGKSSLVGTLTTSVLDNGRGKSRLSMLKHRHEIASGITSSVAHELLGYKSEAEADESAINYATGDVSAWTDIHYLSNRLCFLIDSPGLPRYARSIFRSLISYKPQWTVLCISADRDEDTQTGNAIASAGVTNLPEMSLAHLSLCLRLDLPIVVAITKMDVATKAGLRLVLGKVLSALKTAGRTPMLMSSPSIPVPSFALDSNHRLPDLQHLSLAEQDELDNVLSVISQDQSYSIVPIVMTSVLSGSGLGKLHGLLRHLPTCHTRDETDRTEPKDVSVLFHIDEVFSIPPSKVYSSDLSARLEGQGIVLCGRLDRGKISVGDELHLGPLHFDETNTGIAAPRSKSYSAQDMRRTLEATSVPLAKSLQDDSAISHATKSNNKAAFAAVQVVSLRNLRLPVLSMQQAETGTIGVELVAGSTIMSSLDKVRKGMVLLGTKGGQVAYRSFAATFPATDFVNSSPPLILGGHAIAYINSIRAAVKVTAVALVDNETEASSPTGVFAFDGDDEDEEPSTEPGHQEKEIRITFRFASTVEWMGLGDQVLVVPTVSTTGPVAGPVGTTSGLVGFVGRICEVHV